MVSKKQLIQLIKEDIVLLSILCFLVVVELVLHFGLDQNTDTLVINYDAKGVILLAGIIRMLFYNLRPYGLMFLVFFQLLLGMLYFQSHFQSTNNFILMIFHFTIVPLLIFQGKMQDKLDVYFGIGSANDEN